MNEPIPSTLSGAAATASYATIQHVVVVMQSGHSFDNYFGTYPGANGLSKAKCQPVVAGSRICANPVHLDADSARSGLTDTLRVTKKAINGGKMDGFVSAQPNNSIGDEAMGHLDGSDLPYYWSLATRFTLFDNFYASSQAGALPNRLVAVAGQDQGLTSNTPPAGGITVPTIFDQLDQNNVSWKYYLQGYKGTAPTPSQKTLAPVLDIPAIAQNPALKSRIVDSSQYFVDLAKGDLPAVSYVSGTTDSDRAPQNPAQGEAFVQSLINALMQSREWNHTVLLVTYDDSGGWYDHAYPPNGLGLRVPAILVSPYAKAGEVNNTQLDTASIPAMIDRIFVLPTTTPQEASAGKILSALDLTQHPTSPVVGPDQGAAPALVRPAVGTIYFLYLGALVVVGVLVALAFRQYRRRGPLDPAAPREPEPQT